MSDIDFKISKEINAEQKPEKKGFYRKLEDSYYNTLDKINKVIPIYKIVDPIDKVVPSFILVNIFFLLFIVAIIILLVIFLNSSGMNVEFDFYYDNVRVDENLLVNISYAKFDKNFTTNENILTLKLKKDLNINLKVLSEGYEFENSYVIKTNKIKVNIPKNIVVDTTPKKITIYAYEMPNISSPYSGTLMLNMKCLSSGKTESISLTGTKTYDKAYDCGAIKFTGNVAGFQPISVTCANNETSCAIGLASSTDRPPDVEPLTPKNNLIVKVMDSSNKYLQNVKVALTPKNSTTSIDKNTNVLGTATYPNLEVGQYNLYMEYVHNGFVIPKSDNNVWVVSSNTDIVKTYVLDLESIFKSQFDLNVIIDTYDKNESRYSLEILDVNGNRMVYRRDKTPNLIKTKIPKGKHYLTAIPFNKKYNPIYFYEFDVNTHTNLEFTFGEYDKENYFDFLVTVKHKLDNKLNVVKDAFVTVRSKENNNLVYDSRNTDEDGRATFVLPNDVDYTVFAEKTGFFGSGDFLSENISRQGRGFLDINLDNVFNSISFEFTFDNDEVPYELYVQTNDKNYFFEGEGEINVSLPTAKKLEMSVVYYDSFKVYTYLINPMVLQYNIEYNLKYNYDSKLNYKLTNLKSNQLLSGNDVNNKNLSPNTNYFLGLEAKLKCDNNKLSFDLPYNLTKGFDLKSLNDYLQLEFNRNNNNIKIKNLEGPCEDSSQNKYHYMFGGLLQLTTPNYSLEGFLKYNDKLDKNIPLIVPGDSDCIIIIGGVDIKSLTKPYIISAGIGDKNIIFSNGCGAIEYINPDKEKFSLDGNTLTLGGFGKYTFDYRNTSLDVYVFGEYEDILGSPFEEIKVNYTNDVNCEKHYCSYYQLHKYNPPSNDIDLFCNGNLFGCNPYKDLYLSRDVFSFGRLFKGKPEVLSPGFYNVGVVTNQVYSINELYKGNHLFYYLPLRGGSDFLSKSELKPTGSLSNKQLCFANDVCRTKTNETHGVDYLVDIKYSTELADLGYIFSVLHASTRDYNNFDLNLQTKIIWYGESDVLKTCNYDDKQIQYLIYKDRINYVLSDKNLIPDLNRFENVKIYFFGRNLRNCFYNLPHIKKVGNLQNVIDLYNKREIVYTYQNNIWFYYWNIDKLIKDLNPNTNELPTRADDKKIKRSSVKLELYSNFKYKSKNK